MYNPFSLEGKTVLVTGASSGIGRATAIECSKLGATLVLTGRNESALQETKELLSDSNKEHVIHRGHGGNHTDPDHHHRNPPLSNGEDCS